MTRTLQSAHMVCVCVCVRMCAGARGWSLSPCWIIAVSLPIRSVIFHAKGRGVPKSLRLSAFVRLPALKAELFDCIWRIGTYCFLKSLRRTKKKRVKLFFSLVSNTGRCGYNLTDRRASDACDVLKMCSGMESSLRGWFGHECVGAGRMWAWQHKEAGFLLVSGACWVHEVPHLTQRSRWCESMAVYNGCKEGE